MLAFENSKRISEEVKKPKALGDIRGVAASDCGLILVFEMGNISEANLENVLSALAALFLLERHLLSILIDDNTYVLLKPSSIFKIEGVDIQPKMSWIAKKDGGMALIYDDEE